MNHIELSGGLVWIFTIVILVTASTVLITGAYCILNFLWWDILVTWALKLTKNWLHFARCIVYYKPFKIWWDANKHKTTDQIKWEMQDEDK